jgi:methionine synthase / methylenetetrahydrofolate reductase(NADPH)
MANLLEVLEDQILIGDGATGTYLYSLGVAADHCLEEVNLSQPELITRVYEDYIGAGARIIETNSFGANKFRLARYGLEGKAGEINWKAARLAVDAAKGKDVFVAGSVGPLSLRPTDPTLTVDERKELFRAQIGALLDGGCDYISLETFTDLNELLLALEVFQNLSNIPVATLLAVSEEGRLGSGQDLATVWQKLREAGADIIGINGSCGIQASLHLLSGIEVGVNDCVAVYPNAGKPAFYEGRFNYEASPEYFAENLPRFVAEGARIVGGDYGTTPTHIAALVQALDGLKPVKTKAARPKAKARITTAERKPAAVHAEEDESLLDELAHKTVTIVELDSPKTLAMDKFLAGAQALKDSGASAITLADNSLAILRVSNFAAAMMLRDKVGITPLLHVACRDRNLLGLQSELLGLGTFGFRNVLAITGDPAKAGDHPGATSVYDVNSIGLIKLMAGMNRGVNAIGKSLNGQTKFVIGCAFNPNALNFDSQLKKLESKIAAGAQYVMTQPVFDPALATKTAQRLKPLGIPVFIGIMPLLHSRNAEFLHNEVPGIKIPENVRDRLRAADEKDGPAIGLELAREIRQTALEHFRGVYIITPFLRYELSVQLIAADA